MVNAFGDLILTEHCKL